MYNVNIVLTKGTGTLPSGVSFAQTDLSVTDAAGTVRAFKLNGSETPPWSASAANLADGVSTYSAQDMDTTGQPIGPAVTTSFTPAVTTFPQTTGITVTQA